MFITADQLVAHAIGDYILQSDWMAQNKTKAMLPAVIHALTYSLVFAFWFRPSIIAGLVIYVTHLLIDRFRLARYVVWLKNWMGPWYHTESLGEAVQRMRDAGQITGSTMEIGDWVAVKVQRIRSRAPWQECSATGYSEAMPSYLAIWLLIIADNIIHVLINGAALKFL